MTDTTQYPSDESAPVAAAAWQTAPVGFPITYTTGTSDPGTPGTVCAATVVGVAEDGNLNLMVAFPSGMQGRQHVPHSTVDLTGLVSANGRDLPFTGGTWDSIKES